MQMLGMRPYLFGLLAAGAIIAGCGGSVAGVPSDAAEEGLRVDTEGWKTDFSKHSLPLGEFVSGGQPRDGIPPIDEPKFVSAERAAEFLAAREPVMAVEMEGRARGYPLQILVWHEIVNDVLAGRPIAVTYCPLCNSSLVFDRTVDGRTLRLGTTGNLRHSDLVMWDDATESWWQQITGQAGGRRAHRDPTYAHRLTDAELRRLPGALPRRRGAQPRHRLRARLWHQPLRRL
jgi:hypothetical protein